MRKFNGNSSQRLAAQARSKKEMPEQQALSSTEPVSGQRARFGQVQLQNPNYPIARIDNVLGDFSEQTGASFG